MILIADDDGDDAWEPYSLLCCLQGTTPLSALSPATNHHHHHGHHEGDDDDYDDDYQPNNAMMMMMMMVILIHNYNAIMVMIKNMRRIIGNQG